MSNTPKLSIAFSNNNLLQNIANIDGEAAFIGTGLVSGNLNKVFVINSLADAITQGITLSGEPAAYRQIKEFYEELGGNQEIFVLLLASTVTMAQMLDSTDAAKAGKLIAAAAGKIAYLGVFRNGLSAAPGANFMDADVSAAVTAAKTFVQAQNTNLNFLRVLIEGRVNDETSNTIFAPNTATNGFAGVVLGGTLNDKSASVGLALGRKVKYACHIKQGKVANGSLSATSIYIGTHPLKDVTNLDALHGDGYMSFVTYPGKAGFFFGIDNMASADDFSILAHGAVTDAAARVATIVYTEDLEGEVDTNPDGTITELDAKHLEDKLEQQVKVSLGDRISGFAALVDRTSNIINTNKTGVKLRVRPKGYNTFIDVDLGLTAGV